MERCPILVDHPPRRIILHPVAHLHCDLPLLSSTHERSQDGVGASAGSETYTSTGSLHVGDANECETPL